MIDHEARGDITLISLILLALSIIVAVMFIGMVVTSSKAHAHDQWADGKTIPDWVKASCCGPADAHHLTPDMVHRVSDEYYRVDGYDDPIPVSLALPSQDGDYWIFYADKGRKNCSPEAPASGCFVEPYQSGVYCFFVPMAF